MIEFREIVMEIDLEEYGRKQFRLIHVKQETNLNSVIELAVEKNNFVSGTVRIEEMNHSYIVSVKLECIMYPYDYFRSFKQKCAAALNISIKQEKFKALAIEKFDPFWTRPIFFNDEGGESGYHIQNLLMQMDKKYIHVLPVSGENGVSEICYDVDIHKASLYISTYSSGKTQITSNMAIITEGDDPYEAIRESYEVAHKKGIMKTSLKKNKRYPKQLDGLGWCTWNAFYHGVTELGIEEKLKEFKEKNIPLKWLMIDDGWAQVRDFKLCSFSEDRKKFPSGLKAFIERIKSEYGIQYVGIWHSFTGYWFGIEENSDVYFQQKENLTKTNSGLYIPSGEYEKAYAFYSAWHKYLRKQGVDFLKVDTQGNALEFYKGMPNAPGRVVNMHKALEQSVEENFDGVLIDCMGLSNLNMFSRRISTVVRNSNDFFPDIDKGFKQHIEQNLYNAVFNDQLFFCDYDMWWTKHFSAKQNSMLRGVSGGPIYISDEVGDTQKLYLDSLLDENGNIVRYDEGAKLTADCLFGYDKVLKVVNYIGNEYTMTIFNLSNEDQEVKTRMSDLWQMEDRDACIVEKVAAGDVKKVCGRVSYFKRVYGVSPKNYR